MNRIIVLIILLLINSSCNGQKEMEYSETLVDDINRLLNEIETSNKQVLVRYDTKDSTLIIKEDKSDGTHLKEYRLIVLDIHPDGIYFMEKNDSLSIKLISTCSGNVFIDTKFRNGIRSSKITDKVIIGPYSIAFKNKINRICKLMNLIVSNHLEKNKEEEEQIIIAPSTRKKKN